MEHIHEKIGAKKSRKTVPLSLTDELHYVYVLTCYSKNINKRSSA
jgi:hypothetical protein